MAPTAIIMIKTTGIWRETLPYNKKCNHILFSLYYSIWACQTRYFKSNIIRHLIMLKYFHLQYSYIIL